MKRLLVCLLCLLSFHSEAQGVLSPAPAAEFIVPPKAEQKFVLENPEAKAKWKKEGEHFKAMFISPLNNLGYITVYDSEGNIMRKERELEKQEYPPLINDYFEKNFPGEGFVMWSSIDSSGNQTFYSPRGDETLRFDKNGKITNRHQATIADTLLSPAR